MRARAMFPERQGGSHYALALGANGLDGLDGAKWTGLEGAMMDWMEER